MIRHAVKFGIHLKNFIGEVVRIRGARKEPSSDELPPTVGDVLINKPASPVIIYRITLRRFVITTVLCAAVSVTTTGLIAVRFFCLNAL